MNAISISSSFRMLPWWNKDFFFKLNKMNESQDALKESTNGHFKQSCHCLLQLIKIPIKFWGCDSNIFPLIYVLDKDCDWQVTEAGVIRRQIQKPERSSEEVSKPTFYFFKNVLC